MAIWWTFLLLISSLQEPEPRTLQPVWEHSFEERVHGVALSSSGSCAAVTTDSSVVVLNKEGSELWRWDFRKNNRFIVANRIAVSPACDWTAFVGDPGYKYVWIVHQRGSRIPLQFGSTPQGVSIDHKGDRLAVGTAGNEVRLFSSQGKTLWSRSQGDVIQEIAFSDDDQTVMVTAWNGAVISVNGDVRWSRSLWVGGMRPALDLKTFVAWSQPPHGPGVAQVSLLDQGGETLWTRIAPSEPQAAITRSGDLVAFRLFADQSITQAFVDQEPEHSLAILSRTGEVVRKLSGEGYPIAFSDDGRLLLVRRRTSIDAVGPDDHISWTIRSTSYAAQEVWTLPNLQYVLVRENDTIRWFAP